MEKVRRKTKQGAIGSEMRRRVDAYTKDMSKRTQAGYNRACRNFDAWRKENNLTNGDVRRDPRAAVEQWRDALQAADYSVGTIHTYVAGVCCGLGIDMTGIAKSATSADKRKSLGLCERSQKARTRSENAKIVHFQEMVGGRRQALQRLTGADLIRDESGHLCVRFLGDKGGKDQLQRIDPANLEEVKAYFDAVGPEELLFPDQIDKNLDLHGIRSEHARSEYDRYAKICSTEEGRAKMREHLWRRYTDPEIGCKAYLQAKKAGNKEVMRSLRIQFASEMKDGTYYLQQSNRRIAQERGLPVGYDRLALCCVSVFALSHWRNEVTVKHYMI